MKIICISKYSAIPGRGNRLRHFLLCREFVKKGHEVTLITSNSHLTNEIPFSKENYLIENVEGVNVIWLKMPKYTKTASVKRILSWFIFEYKIIRYVRLFHIESPDFVYCSSLSLLSFFSGFYFKKRWKSRFAFEVRDIWPMSLVDLTNISKYNPFVLFLQKIEKWAYLYSDVLIGTMPGLYKHARSIIHKDINCICIPQGLDISYYEHLSRGLDNSFFDRYFPQDRLTITFAGQLTSSFALVDIIKTARLLEQMNVDIIFNFIGEGDDKEKLKEYSIGLLNVNFIPSIPKECVIKVLERSTLLMHAFFDKEHHKYGISPNKFIDYMYSARPILVMYSGFQSLINEAECGEFIPTGNINLFANKIREYTMKSPQELNEIGQRGKDFLIKNMQYKQLAHKLLVGVGFQDV